MKMQFKDLFHNMCLANTTRLPDNGKAPAGKAEMLIVEAKALPAPTVLASQPNGARYTVSQDGRAAELFNINNDAWTAILAFYNPGHIVSACLIWRNRIKINCKSFIRP